MEFAPLQTERLTLRLHARSDIPALMPLIGAREVAATTLRIPHPYTEADAQDFMAGTQEELLNGSGLRLGIVVRESDTLCGGVGLRIEPDIVAPNLATGLVSLIGERGMPRKLPGRWWNMDSRLFNCTGFSRAISLITLRRRES